MIFPTAIDKAVKRKKASSIVVQSYGSFMFGVWSCDTHVMPWTNEEDCDATVLEWPTLQTKETIEEHDCHVSFSSWTYRGKRDG